MMDEVKATLDALAAEDNLRTLRTASGSGRQVIYDGRQYVNLSSNDYLGLSGDVALQRRFLERIGVDGRFVMSNPSSRLITGNSDDYDRLEEAVAALYPGKRVLVLGSGYLANAGVLPALAGKEDLVLADKFVHASLIDGLRLCGCEWRRFNHNDTDHLETILRKSRDRYRNVWVAAESVYSMDGDRAPLAQLVELKERYGLLLYIDEAHAFGVYGGGAGCAAEDGLDREVDVLMGTFGKAAASYGAFVALAGPMRELLVNRMRTLIFATALPPVVLQWSCMIVEMFPEMEGRRRKLKELISILAPGNSDASHIIPVMSYGNAEAGAMAERFRAEGFWVTPIRYPTVPRGRARIRLSLSAALETADAQRFVEVWKSIG